MKLRILNLFALFSGIVLAFAGCSKEEEERFFLLFDKSNLELVNGSSEQLTLSIRKDGSNIKEAYDLSSNPKNLTFASSLPGVAMVDASGKVTGLKAGTAMITVTGDNCEKATCVVKVLSVVEAAEELHIGSFNLWVHATGTDEWAWALRKPILAKSIVENGFDIFGFQEADATIKSELPALVKAAGREYSWWFVGRDAQDGSSGEAVGIAYDASKFTIADQHYFWLSETPDVISYGWDETKYHRIAVCATFTLKSSGAKFFFMATHGPLADTANDNSAQLLIDREKMYNPGVLPSFLVGDMNAYPSSKFSSTCRTWWKDPVVSLDASKLSGPYGTFNSHNTSRDMDSNANYRIDYVYYRSESNHLYVSGYTCNNKKYNSGTSTTLIYPSDHLPIYITARIY